MKQKRKSPSLIPDAGDLFALMQKGMTQTEIGNLYGVTPSAICVKLRRAGFAPTREYGGNRVTRIKTPEMIALLKKHPAPSETKHSDRVTRVTPTGSRITLARVSYIDGIAE
jgi:hypothetical protein